MIHWLMSLLGALTERRFRGLLLGVGAVAVSALLGAVALGFGTLAAYAYLRASQGVVGAALIICFAYVVLAILTGAVAMICRRADRLACGAASAPPPAPSENVDLFFRVWLMPALHRTGKRCSRRCNSGVDYLRYNLLRSRLSVTSSLGAN